MTTNVDSERAQQRVETTDSQSILALDVGAAFTKAALFDSVEGQPRFLAQGRVPSTLCPPGEDVGRGAELAVQRLGEVVGRPLLGTHGLIVPERAEGQGVDACFTVSSVSGVLPTMAIGSTTQRVIELARSIGTMPGIGLVGTIGLDAELPSRGSRIGQILDVLQKRQPRALVIADGDARGTGLAELAQMVTIHVRSVSSPPTVVFLGNEDTVSAMQRSLPERIPLHCLPAAAASGEEFAQLQELLQLLWHEHWQNALPGSATLDSWSEVPAFPIQHGFANALRFLEAQRDVDVWGLDIGAATASAIGVVGGILTSNTCTDLGVGQGSLALLGEPAAVSQWLPFPFSSNEGEVGDAVLHKYLHPFAVPETKAELALEGAMVREIAGRVLGGLPQHSRSSRHAALLVGRGAALSEVPGIAQSVLLLLDAFQPVGMVELAVDKFGLLPAIGAIARRLPQMAAELLLHDGLRQLGPCIALGGMAREGAVAAKITVQRPGEKTTRQVHFGKIELLPIGEGETAEISIKPVDKLDCGAGPGRRATFTVRGGPLGIVIDARGRPLAPSSYGDGRLDRLAEWREALGT